MDDHTEPEEDTKIDIKEACIDLNYIKKEPKEEIIELDGNNYAGTSEEVSIKREVEADLLDPLDTDIIMENEFVKLEDIKEESRRFRNFYCSKCNGVYKGYCLKCSTLSRILNNVPADILEIRDTLMGKGVFLLKALPKNITFGPFEDVPPIESTKGYSWKIKDKKLVNIENGSWIKDVACAVNAVIKNSDIFQFDGKLFLETTKELVEGDEILIYYDDEEIQASDNSEEYYFIPQKRDELPKVFACTLCCYGFSSNECLVEHKSKCPHAEHNEHVQDLELIQCNCCKIWLEKREHEDYHKAYCGRKNQRMSDDRPKSLVKNEMSLEKISENKTNEFFEYGINGNNSDMIKLLNCKSEMYYCATCFETYAERDNLLLHMEANHGKGTVEYSSSKRGNNNFNKHTNVHKEFATNSNLRPQTKNKHTVKAKYRKTLIRHQDAHLSIKPFQCDICMKQFTRRMHLHRHTKDQHASPGTSKDYKCSGCSYQTNCKRSLTTHLNVHNGVKPYQCDVCQMKYTQKSSLNKHIKKKHMNKTIKKNYNCLQNKCSTMTSNNFCSSLYSNKQVDDKSLQCDGCMTLFTDRGTLERHVRIGHGKNGIERKHKCSKCYYQSDRISNFKRHLKTHKFEIN